MAMKKATGKGAEGPKKRMDTGRRSFFNPKTGEGTTSRRDLTKKGYEGPFKYDQQKSTLGFGKPKTASKGTVKKRMGAEGPKRSTPRAKKK